MTTGILLALWITLNDAGKDALQHGKAAEAAVAFRRAAEEAEGALGAAHPATAMLLRNLAVAYEAEGLHAKAEAAARRSLAILEARFGPQDSGLVPSLNALGEALVGMGRMTEARKVFQRAASLDLEGPHGATALHNLGAVAVKEKHCAEARSYYETAFRRRQAILGADDPATRSTGAALKGLSNRHAVVSTLR